MWEGAPALPAVLCGGVVKRIAAYVGGLYGNAVLLPARGVLREVRGYALRCRRAVLQHVLERQQRQFVYVIQRWHAAQSDGQHHEPRGVTHLVLQVWFGEVSQSLQQRVHDTTAFPFSMATTASISTSVTFSP